MRVLRALDRLSVGIERNEAFLENRLQPENIALLLARGRISIVNTPPLLVMMFDHVGTFDELGVTTFEELFDSEFASEQLKANALEIFQPEKTSCTNCRR